MKKKSFHSCNVLEVRTEARHLWHFAVGKNQVRLAQDRAVPAAEALPAPLVQRDWRGIFQPRLNIAWLPADQVFLRVIHLPKAELAELTSMVEFQLEKLSPIPVAQIVWSMELVPGAPEGQQTIIVVITARTAVEEFLGQLETDKFLADRIELPQLQALAAVPAELDGVWIYPVRAGAGVQVLVAWWIAGVLQQVQFMSLPQAEAASALVVEQIHKTAWAGEVEGWLPAPVRWHLVADVELATVWQPVLDASADDPVTAAPPLGAAALAEGTARRAVQGEALANLLPAEFATRYRQQFVDRLWMAGLGAVVGAYILGVLIYFGVLFTLRWQKDRVEKQVKSLATSYTNAIKLQEKIDVLQTQLDLKYAALDSFKAVSENLPEDFVLNDFSFQKGKTVRIAGTAPTDQYETATKFARNLREASAGGVRVFANVPVPTWTAAPGAQSVRWDVTCTLRQTETN